MTYQEIAEKLKAGIDDVKATMRKHGLNESMIVEQADLDSLAQKMGIAVNVPISKMAVSRTPAPTAGLAVKPQTPSAIGGRKRSRGRNPETPQNLSFKPIAPVEPMSVAQTVGDADVAEQEILAAELALAKINQAASTVQMLSKSDRIARLAEYNMLFQYYGLEGSSDLEVCEQRWQQFYQEQRDYVGSIRSEADQLINQVNQLVSCIPGMEGVRL